MCPHTSHNIYTEHQESTSQDYVVEPSKRQISHPTQPLENQYYKNRNVDQLRFELVLVRRGFPLIIALKVNT